MNTAVSIPALNRELMQPDLKKIAMLEGAVTDFQDHFSGKKTPLQLLRSFVRHQFRDYYFVSPPLPRVLWRMRNWQQRMVPAFASTGSIRSGTSTLSNYILQHPCVLPPLSKELAVPIPRLSCVRAQFPTLAERDEVIARYGQAMTGDCTPMFPLTSAVFWAKAINPEMKFVIVLRDPVERSISHWRWSKLLVRNFDQDELWKCLPDFDESVRLEIRDFNEGGAGFRMFSGAAMTSFIRHSIYLPILKTLEENFGADNIQVINANDLFADPFATARQVYQFLGLPDYEPLEINETNPSPPLRVSDETRAQLVEFFRPHNERLYEYLGRDLGWS